MRILRPAQDERWWVSRPYSMPTRHSREGGNPGKYYFTNL
jgi:hypothetical protein